jgi:quercetin dioxygenase-like cupin family protein
MKASRRPAIRSFSPEWHRVPVVGQELLWVDLYDNDGNVLDGIRGHAGAYGRTETGEEIGVDCIEMAPGSRFPLHTHPGDHILYGLAGSGSVRINGVSYTIERGMTFFIAAEQPHAVQGPDPEDQVALAFLAFGVPHEHLASPERMQVVGVPAAGSVAERPALRSRTVR